MEFHPKGDLLTAIYRNTLTFKEKGVIAKEGLKALVFLDEKKVIHRDIKEENILLNKENKPVFADLEFMCHMEEDKQRELMCGTPECLTPQEHKLIYVPNFGARGELIYNEDIPRGEIKDLTTPQRNVYEFGVLLASLFYNRFIKDSKNAPAHSFIMSAFEIILVQHPDQKPLLDVISKMIEPDQTKRISPKEALACFETIFPHSNTNTLHPIQPNIT